MQRSSNGAGRTGSNVLGAMAPITASSRAARGDCSSATRVASRPLSKRERSSLQASCRCASGSGTAWRLGVSGRNRCLRERIVGGLESLSEAGAERAVIDGAANLKQKIRPSPRPAHLLRFVHPAVHQKIGRPFGDRGANPQSGTVPLGVVDQPVALSGEITIQCVQGGPQLSRRRNGPPLPLFPLKVMHHFQGEQGQRRSIAPSRKLWTALHALDGYLTGQSDWLVNYAERHRAGLRVGTAITEGTANFLVNRRMNKSQQMRWSRRGADLLLQVRCAVYNGTLGSGYGNLFEPVSTSTPPLMKAA